MLTRTDCLKRRLRVETTCTSENYTRTYSTRINVNGSHVQTHVYHNPQTDIHPYSYSSSCQYEFNLNRRDRSSGAILPSDYSLGRAV